MLWAVQQRHMEFKYFACDDALTFCVPVQQSYKITLARDLAHAWSVPTEVDGTLDGSRRPSWVEPKSEDK